MDQKINKQLKEIYSAPVPQRKDVFLKTYRRKEISMGKFYLIQLSFISPLVWIVSLAIFVIILLRTSFDNSTMNWVASSLVPLLALVALTENHKSERYGMSELEMSSRFSLKSIIMVRMSVIGIFHILILFFLALLSFGINTHTMAYLLVPYLLTANLGSIICRHIHGNESFHLCIVAAVLVSMAGLVSHTKFTFIFTPNFFLHWCVALAVTMLFTIINIMRTVKENYYEAYN